MIGVPTQRGPTFAPAASNIVRLAVTGMDNRSQISPNPTPCCLYVLRR
jgi:hypothetical protein